MNTLVQILGSGPDPSVYTMPASASAQEAVRLMVDKNIGALVVVDRGQVVGLVSERDCTSELVLPARSPTETSLADMTSSPVMVVHRHHTSDECMVLMSANRTRHLPVMAGDQLIGVVSSGDLVTATISEQQFIIEQLEHHVTGQRG